MSNRAISYRHFRGASFQITIPNLDRDKRRSRGDVGALTNQHSPMFGGPCVNALINYPADRWNADVFIQFTRTRPCGIRKNDDPKTNPFISNIYDCFDPLFYSFETISSN